MIAIIAHVHLPIVCCCTCLFSYGFNKYIKFWFEQELISEEFFLLLLWIQIILKRILMHQKYHIYIEGLVSWGWTFGAKLEANLTDPISANREILSTIWFIPSANTVVRQIPTVRMNFWHEASMTIEMDFVTNSTRPGVLSKTVSNN